MITFTIYLTNGDKDYVMADDKQEARRIQKELNKTNQVYSMFNSEGDEINSL